MNKEELLEIDASTKLCLTEAEIVVLLRQTQSVYNVSSHSIRSFTSGVIDQYLGLDHLQHLFKLLRLQC
jgi:hydrogenase/urease accessory protein HupE